MLGFCCFYTWHFLNLLFFNSAQTVIMYLITQILGWLLRLLWPPAISRREESGKRLRKVNFKKFLRGFEFPFGVINKAFAAHTYLFFFVLLVSS